MEEQARDPFSQPLQEESEDGTGQREIESLKRALEEAKEAVRKRLTRRRPQRALPPAD